MTSQNDTAETGTPIDHGDLVRLCARLDRAEGWGRVRLLRQVQDLASQLADAAEAELAEARSGKSSGAA